MVAGLVAALVFLFAPPAAADPGHGEHAGVPVVSTQAVGPYVLRVRITPPGSASGLVVIDIDAPERPVSALDVAVSALPVGGGGAPFADQVAVTPDDPGPYSFRMPVEGPGRWELRIEAAGPAGSGVGAVPFAVAEIPDLPLEVALQVASAGAALAVAAVVVLVLTTGRARSRRWALGVAGGGALVLVVVAGTLGVQVVTVPAAERLPTTATPGARPPVQLLLTNTPTETDAVLEFELVDGYTGRPVDDLVPHHEALVHLVVVHDQAGFVSHLHPARTAPGRFSIDVPGLSPGRHTVLVEVTRLGSGGQLARAAFTVGDGLPTPAPSRSLPGRHELGEGLAADADVDLAPAGRASTLRFHVTHRSSPVDGLDPWLGMPGHLLIRDTGDEAVFAHVHAATAMSVAGAPPRRSPGPDLVFVYTFPRPGRYQIWMQFLHDRGVRTVSGVVDIPVGTPADVPAGSAAAEEAGP